ncbi:MAG: hypothetical protein KatS3mg112_1801 [Thermogutta sp.]|nr:MAG: hypothetical protein KatS3mg112_1801 [Thermogutta sp.]
MRVRPEDAGNGFQSVTYLNECFVPDPNQFTLAR